jgi:transposase
MAPGGDPVGDERWAELAAEWFPGVAGARPNQVTWGEFDKHADWIAAQMDAGVVLSVVHQRLRDEHGLAASLSSLRRWVAGTMPERRRPAATGLMPPPPPGQVAQVDYGLMGAWEDPVSGKKTRVNAFVMTLPFSRMVFVYPVVSMDQASWSAAHIAAFEFFGRVPARIVPDNLKTGVVKANLYEPLVNRSYRELADHYGVLIDPARVRAPRDKPHVERAVPYVRGSWWAGREFASLPGMRADAERWCREVAACRTVRALAGRTPGDVFKALEAPAMRALPPTRHQIATWHRAKVGPDCHCQVQGCLYSAPYRLIGRTLDIRLTEFRAEFYWDGSLVKTHPRAPSRRRQTDVGDYPPEHAAYLTRDAAWCRRRAEEIGPDTARVVELLMTPYALGNLRQCQGIIRLAERCGPGKVEAAASVALKAGNPAYRTIKNLCEAPGGGPKDTPTGGDGGAGGILRGPAAFGSGRGGGGR